MYVMYIRVYSTVTVGIVLEKRIFTHIFRKFAYTIFVTPLLQHLIQSRKFGRLRLFFIYICHAS